MVTARRAHIQALLARIEYENLYLAGSIITKIKTADSTQPGYISASINPVRFSFGGRVGGKRLAVRTRRKSVWLRRPLRFGLMA